MGVWHEAIGRGVQHHGNAVVVRNLALPVAEAASAKKCHDARKVGVSPD